jgi:hypothetical protein
VALFYWKILFTKQFSILTGWEPVVQSYSWYNFAAVAIQQGVLPIWDPYRFSGSTFIGEMQTGLFYPLKFLVYFMPLHANGLVSERVYNQLFVLTHLLAAVFMFFLARHLRLSPYASFVSGLAFSLGGFLSNTGHPHMLDSGIWLPLIVLLFLRSVDETSFVRAAFLAAAAGIGVGMAILGGGLHMVIMAGIVVAGMIVMLCVGKRRPQRVLALGATVALVGLLFGGVQLLPSMEYWPMSYRWVGGPGPIQSQDKVPYQYIGELARFSPRSLFSFLFRGASPGSDHETHNYMGVLTLFLSVIGAWQFWRERWVKYFAVLGALAFVYSWGSFSFLHGVLYLLPLLDMAREAGRFIHITHFAMAILAGYGIEHLFSATISKDSRIWTFVRGIRWIVVLLVAVLTASILQTTVGVPEWAFMSLVFIGSGYVLFEVICRGFRSVSTKVALVFFLLWDLYAADWVIRNKALARAEKQDHLAEILDVRELGEFLRPRDSLFRIHFEAEIPPNIGHAYGVHMTGGMGATMLMDYARYLDSATMPRLLNVRYTLRRANPEDHDKPVFSDDVWRVYENDDVGERAWVVHRIEVDSSADKPPRRLFDPDFDPGRVAILERPLPEPIADQAESEKDSVETRSYGPTSMEFVVNTKGRGLLVVSEVFYPGWQAFVNDSFTPIYRVDGLLRGVVVPDGTSVVRFHYRPLSVRIGAALSILAALGTLVLGAASAIKRRPT